MKKMWLAGLALSAGLAFAARRPRRTSPSAWRAP